MRGFYFACRLTLALCIFIFIFTSAAHWWLKAARAARASSRVAPRLLWRRLGCAGGCQGRLWAAAWGAARAARPFPSRHWAASGVLVGGLLGCRGLLMESRFSVGRVLESQILVSV